MTAPLVFLDTETDGLHPSRKVWEIAMIRREDTIEKETSFFVALDLRYSDPFGFKVGGFWDRHPSGRKISGKDASPADSAPVYSCHDAAKTVMAWTFGAHIVGANPAFDTETLAKLLRHEGYLPSWHHHLIDIEAMAYGYCCGQYLWSARMASGAREVMGPPWKSDALAELCGVKPATDAERHTALGDAHWVRRWYDAMVGGQS